MNAQEIIQKAKELFPCGYHYTGRLTDEDREEIKAVCNVHTMAVHMSGNHTYRIVYLEESVKEKTLMEEISKAFEGFRVSGTPYSSFTIFEAGYRAGMKRGDK